MRLFVLLLCTLITVPAFAGTVPPRDIKDLVALLDQYHPDPAQTEAVHRALLAAPPPGADQAALASFYLERARLAADAGRVAQQISDLRKVLEYGGGTNPARVHKELSHAEFMGGDFAAALAHNQTATSLIGKEQRGMLLADLAARAEMARRLGNFDEADKAMKEAERMLGILKSRSPAWKDLQHNWLASFLHARGRALLVAGKPVEAEAVLVEALQERELDLPLNLARKNRGMDGPSQGQLEAVRDNQELHLADALMQQGRLFEAEIHVRQVLQRVLGRVGRYSFQTASATMQYTRLLLMQRRAAEAETMARLSLDILEKIGATPDSLFVIQSRRLLAGSFVARGQWSLALAQYQAMQVEGARAHAAQLAGGDISWALCLIRTGQPKAALAMLEPLLERSIRSTGNDSVQTAELRGFLGLAQYKLGALAPALAALRSAGTVLIAAQHQGGEGPSPLRQARLAAVVDAYIALLADIRNTPLEKKEGINATAEAFRLADFARSQSVQQAVAAAAVRNAAGTPELAELIRKTQDLHQEETSLLRVLVDQMSAPPEKQLSKVIADMRARIAEIGRERQGLMGQVTRQFPSYAELVAPAPPSIEQTQAALRPGEALVSIVTAENASYIWAIPKQGPVAFASSRLGRAEIEKLVIKLRRALDPGDVDIEQIPEFDLDAAYSLFAQLLQPVASGWQGSHNLLISTSGSLSQLPFSLLPTSPEKPAPGKLLFAHLAQVPWLIRQTAVTHIPSVSALLALRKQGTGSANRLPFIGFGDPDFMGGGRVPPPSVSAGTRRVRISHRAGAYSQENAREGSAWMDYSRIPPLPDTRDEILSLAQALGADPGKDVFLGRSASKENVRTLDLSQRRIVAFATHGLVSGDFPGVDQPSLALANPGGGKDGLLTLEEILGLKLDADWVVLSACNTAAGEGAGAEAVSGLGRGFFYAGSRALLVTHWPVETVSAKMLVTGTFTRYAADPQLSRAEALRQSMLALMNTPSGPQADYSYAHPMFWAPYALVGDGGAH